MPIDSTICITLTTTATIMMKKIPKQEALSMKALWKCRAL
jgi:hypothetical protein